MSQRAATIASLAFEFVKAMQATGLGWDKGYRPLGRQAIAEELSLNLGDVRDQAAAACGLTTSIPSANFTPRMTFGNWLWPSRRGMCQ